MATCDEYPSQEELNENYPILFIFQNWNIRKDFENTSSLIQHTNCIATYAHGYFMWWPNYEGSNNVGFCGFCGDLIPKEVLGLWILHNGQT